MNCSCILCKKVFSARGIHTHYYRQHLGYTQYSSGNNGAYEKISKRARDKYYRKPKKCENCNITIPYEKKNNRFCSRTCSGIYSNRIREKNGYKVSKDTCKKISETLSGREYFEPQEIESSCDGCGKLFKWIKKSNEQNRKFCSFRCVGKYHPTHVEKRKKAREKRKQFINYKSDCSFKFNLKDYPDEFDFELVEEHGWYSARNRGNNMRGVSRDHMFSVKEGFIKGVSSHNISHPANCQLMLHSDNAKKQTKCSITLEELLQRIEEWEEKYKDK